MPDSLDKPADGGGFFSRWSQRKAQARVGAPLAEPVVTAVPTPTDTRPTARVAAPVVATESPDATPAAEKPAPPTLDDVAALTHESDYARFVARDVDGPVRNAALKKLFTDPHFNVMDGLDTYIDDYGIPDPLPEGMLRQMAQAQFLGLFRDEDKATQDAERVPEIDLATAHAPDAGTLPALNDDIPPDEDPDLRLQPHDAAGRPGAEPGPGELAPRQH